MKHLLPIFFLLPFACKAQQTDTLTSAWLASHYIKKEVRITMRDGVKLFTSLYIPNDKSENHPFLLTRTPYSCAPYGEDKRYRFRRYQAAYLREGYIMVTQDVRGRWMSEGKFVDVRPYMVTKRSSNDIDESSDTYDTIDWLIRHIPQNNGKVGVEGISYPGFYSTMAALSNHPALKAVSPQAPVTEWFIGDDFHHNGAFMQMDAFAFYTNFGRPRPAPTKIEPKDYKYSTEDNYAFYLQAGTLPHLARLMGDSIAFWKDIYAHPNYDAWWKARNTRNFVQYISPKIAMLEVGGLFDAEDCFGAWNLYKSIETKTKLNNRLVMGPWYHGQWASGDGTHLGNVQFGSNTSKWYTQNVEVPFFNYYLKGIGNADTISEATVFFTGEDKWHKLPKWPPPEMQPREMYLEPGGKLSLVKSEGETPSYAEYISDPAKPVPYTEKIHFERTREYMTDDQRFAARRPDVLVFETDTLSQDVSCAGPLVADLKVSLSTTDADFVVKLIDVFPDNFTYPVLLTASITRPARAAANMNYLMNGYQMLVRGDVFRGKFRNSYESPRPFVPGEATQVKYTLPDIAHTFKKGHRIMVQVQSSWFPLVDRNPQKFMNIYQATETDFQKATIKVFYGDSKIILPFISPPVNQ